VGGWNRRLTRIHPDAHPKRIERGASAGSAKRIRNRCAKSATKPLTILIVEDDPMMQMGLSRLLAAQPHFVIAGQVEDGNSAIASALELKPDIVLMDIGLPDIDGIAAASQIKAALPDTRIVMLTSHSSDTEVLASLSCGADAYCIKGTSTEQLLLAINAVKEGSAYLDAKIASCVIQTSECRFKTARNPSFQNEK
jgi:DNA-binding NarL/FixJ family response regulator